MRIGLDILSEIAGRSSGTETYLQGFLKGLARVNDGSHEFFLFVNSACEDFYRIEGGAFTQVHFPFSNRVRPLRVLSQMLLIPYHARKLKLDLVNFLGTTGAFHVGCATVQHVKTLHHLLIPGCVDPRGEAFRKLAVGLSARSADMVIANSESLRRATISLLGVHPDRIVVVPEAVEHTIFFPRRQDDTYQTTLKKYGIEEQYILFVSSLWPHKNAHGLIEAYAILLSQRRIRHKLVIVGGLPTRNYHTELSRLVSARGIANRVHFVGHVSDRREIRDLYVGADVFVYPSYLETFGLTLLESMACGTPVVAADRGALPEVAGDAALLADPDDHKEIADAIWTLLSDNTKRDLYVARGLQRAKEFTWERTARESINAYELAVEFRRRRHGA